MSKLYTICYIVCLFLSLITLLTGIFALKQFKNRLQILPRGLRLFVWTCSLPFGIIINLAAIYFSIVYLIIDTENHWSLRIMRFLITFSAQQIRFSFFIIVCERIIATIFFHNYKYSSTVSLFMGLTAYSYFGAILYTGLSIMIFFIPTFQQYTYILLGAMFITHLNTLLLCPILKAKNKSLYKSSAFQITLKRRYQIFENVKVLSFLLPPMVIYSLIAPFPSLFTIIVGILNLMPDIQQMPSGLFLICYNLSFLLILVQQMLYKRCNRIIPATDDDVQTITNPFGKQLLANGTSETYFKELQHQWNH